MTTIYIAYFSTIGLLCLITTTWSMWQESIDQNLIKKTNELLILKDGLPNPNLTKKIDLCKFNIILNKKFCQHHPCRVHYPNLQD